MSIPSASFPDFVTAKSRGIHTKNWIALEFGKRIRTMTRLLFWAFVISSTCIAPAFAAMTEYPKIRLRSLDKVTARTMTFDARVGTTIKFGSIYIKILSCQKPDLQEQPESAAFLQIWEITPDEQSKWIFSGWMFASSPALSAMDHPIYDVWVIDCLSIDNKSAAQKAEIPVEAETVPMPKAETETKTNPH